MIEYRVVDSVDAKGYPDFLDDDDFHWCIYRFEDGVPIELIGQDGGSPEDQILVRDWKWVAPALQAAYELGRKNVNDSICDNCHKDQRP